jgi:uncharacterized membrane protein YdbT with pleckstrin-like domain
MPQEPETTVWEGASSQWVNAGWFAACLLVLPIPIAIANWLIVRCNRFTLTNQRLRMSRGVLSKRVDDLELYRVKDHALEQPLILRMVGLGNIVLITSDASTPEVVLPAIKNAPAVRDLIRQHVETARSAKRVREVDMT